MNQSYKVINQDHHFSIQSLSLDMIKLKDGKFHMINEGRSFEVECYDIDLDKKTVLLRLNGKVHQVTIKDHLDNLIEELGMNSRKEESMSKLNSPMPGLVLEVDVAVGESVEKGQKLLILEAMKMENVLKSHGSGIIKSILVKKGDSVEKSQLLIEFE